MFRYFGSKASTCTRISEIIGTLTPTGSVADAFGGLGTIGAELRSRDYRVTTCDVLAFPHAFQIARIECQSTPTFSRLAAEKGFENADQVREALNRSCAPSSWFVREYAIKRMFFIKENAVRIAGAWHQIKRWSDSGLLDRRESAFLVSSLLNSMDAVANTAGTYYAHLKFFHRKALRPFSFEWIPVHRGKYQGAALKGDALECLSGKNFNVLYLDPPYNKRNYASYYHLPESMATLERPDTNADRASGVPTSKHPAGQSIRDGMTMEYIERLASNVGWDALIVHYCDGALIPLGKMRTRLKRFGPLQELIVPALGYTTSQSVRAINHHVFVVNSRAH